VELFCRTGQALRIFEDPEGCRHEDYYLKIGQAAIKKPEPSNHHDGLWGQPNAELESTDCKSTPWSCSWGNTIQTHHGAILRCRDVCCVAAHIAIIREVVLSIRIRHLNPTPANPKRLKTATGGLHVFWKATSIRGRYQHRRPNMCQLTEYARFAAASIAP